MRKIVFLFLMMFICGCASTSLVGIDLYNSDVVFPATDPQKVELLRSKPPDNINLTKIGEITIEGDDWINIEKMFKEKAASIGADAVYVISEDKQNEGSWGAGGGSYETRMIVTGVAVKGK